MKLSSDIVISKNIQEQSQKALENVYAQNYDFQSVFEHAYATECEEVFEKTKQFTTLLVLGIGGSALGTSSVLQALGKSLNTSKNVIVLDTIDEETIQKTFEKINWEETCINVISKSGGTLETMLQLSFIESILKEQFPENFSKKASERIICTTGENSLLYNYAQEQNYKTLPVPKNIGGRFSIFTPVGIFPMLFAGVNIPELLTGAKEVQNKKDILTSLVNTQYQAYKEEQRPIMVLMSYHKKLMGLFDWYRQLLAESLGKNNTTGITPVLATGSTDQHSQIQLYNEGPQDKLIAFLSAPFPKDTQTFSVLGIEKKIGLNQAQNSSFIGTKESLKKHQRPFYEIQLEEVTEKEIGAFLMSHMISIVAMAEMLHVNAFDQPGVEEGKIQAKKLLQTC